jgi:hypothetical protein
MTKFLASVALVALSALVGPTQASVIFDLSPTNHTSTVALGDGYGQGVSVLTTIDISGFAFYANLVNGGDVKFMIWNGGNSTLLFDQSDSFAASSAESWISTSGNIDFTLESGSTYFFGFIADNASRAGVIAPAISYSSNGIAAATTGVAVYQNYASPTLKDYGNPVELGLRMSSGVPESSTWAMMGIGFLALGLIGRRTLRPTSA